MPFSKCVFFFFLLLLVCFPEAESITSSKEWVRGEVDHLNPLWSDKIKNNTTFQHIREQLRLSQKDMRDWNKKILIKIISCIICLAIIYNTCDFNMKPYPVIHLYLQRLDVMIGAQFIQLTIGNTQTEKKKTKRKRKSKCSWITY